MCNSKPATVIIARGRIYRAKRPKGCGFPPLCNDRLVVFLSTSRVQYDSPSVAMGRHYPFVDRATFESWAGRDVTDELQPGKWASYPPEPKSDDERKIL